MDIVSRLKYCLRLLRIKNFLGSFFQRAVILGDDIWDSLVDFCEISLRMTSKKAFVKGNSPVFELEAI